MHKLCYFTDKVLYSQSYDFSSNHVHMWYLDHKQGWVPKKLMPSNCDAKEDSWDSLGQQGEKTVNPKGTQPWIFIGRTDT